MDFPLSEQEQDLGSEGKAWTIGAGRAWALPGLCLRPAAAQGGQIRRPGGGLCAWANRLIYIMTNSHMQNRPAGRAPSRRNPPRSLPPTSSPNPQKTQTEDTPEPCLRTPNTSRGPGLPPPSHLALSARLNLNLKSRPSAAAESLVGIERDVAVFIRALCLRITALTRVRL